MKNQPLKLPSFKQSVLRMQELYHRTLPVKIAANAENFFKNSFRNQGFTDQILIPWKATKSGKRKFFGQPSQGILIGSGKLKRSVRTLQKSNGIVHIAAGNQHVPYARIHNEGGIIKKTVNVRSHRRRKTAALSVSVTSLKTRKTSARSRQVVTGYSTVQSHSRRMNLHMPRRQFMGNSHWLSQETERIIDKEISMLERQLFTV